MKEGKFTGLRRFMPIIFLMAVGLAFIGCGGYRYLNFEEIGRMQGTLLGFFGEHPFLSLGIFLAIYFTVVVSLIPGLILLDLVAGFLFGHFLGFFMVIIASSTAALALFLATKLAFGEKLRARSQNLIEKIQKKFDKYQVLILILNR